MKKRIILILIVLAAAGAAVYAYRGMNRPPDNRIVVSGNIELTEVNIAFKTAGRLIERTVDEGDAVKKGQVIARLDRDQLMAQQEREKARAWIRRPTRNWRRRETSLEWQKATPGGRYRDSARPTWRPRKRGWRSCSNGSRPQEKLDAKAAVDAAQSEVDRAKRDWDRAQTLYKDDDISTRAVRPVPQPLGKRRGGAEIGHRARGAGAGRAARGADQRARRPRWSAPARR